uniref:Uncharacterized protein n=1 Tax=Macaca fascicularis TaxID=9541 RepID=A0A7N9CK60_MACFA
CWIICLIILNPEFHIQPNTKCPQQKAGSVVHVHNMQVCYMYIHVPCWCAAPITHHLHVNSSFFSV